MDARGVARPGGPRRSAARRARGRCRRHGRGARGQQRGRAGRGLRLLGHRRLLPPAERTRDSRPAELHPRRRAGEAARLHPGR